MGDAWPATCNRPREGARLAFVEAHETEGLGSLQLAPGTLLAGPPRDHLRRIPRPHLCLVLLEGGDLQIEDVGDVDEGVGLRCAVNVDPADLVGLEPLVE